MAGGLPGSRHRGRVAAKVRTLFVGPLARKDYRGLDRSGKRQILKACDRYERGEQPTHRLQGVFAGYTSVDIGSHLRILTLEEGNHATVIGCGQHEGFYKRMEPRVK